MHYTVDFSRCKESLIDVTLRLPGPIAEGTELMLPVWTPGSYMVRDYAAAAMDVVIAPPTPHGSNGTPPGPSTCGVT